MIVHLLYDFAVFDQYLVAVAEIIEHGIMVIREQQKLRTLPHILNLKAVGVGQISKRQLPDQHRLAGSRGIIEYIAVLL
ncbi:hypothetical protein D3C80_1968660 [compost metagenome]